MTQDCFQPSGNSNISAFCAVHGFHEYKLMHRQLNNSADIFVFRFTKIW